MTFKDFLFSYKNILFKAFFIKKSLFIFLRKIFNTFYKYMLCLARINISKKIENLDVLSKKNNSLFKENLDSLFVKFNTDKGSSVNWNGKIIKGHKYSVFYEKYLKHLKNSKINILEIGSLRGESTASFYYYFPHAALHCADINPFQMKFCSSRIKPIFVDTSSKKILSNLAKYYKNEFDIIIDDASHSLKDQLITISTFFKKLKKGGIYIIEDLNQLDHFPELNVWKDSLTTKKILENINNKKSFNSQFISEEENKYLFNNIKNIYFEKGSFINDEGINLSEIAFIKKI